MTNRAIRFDSASSTASAPSSGTPSAAPSTGTDGRHPLLAHTGTLQRSGSTGTVYMLEPVHVEADDGFDALLAEFEADPEGAQHLAEGRKWVAEQFYADAPTLASLRLAAGLSQQALGDAAGLKQPHVARYESGKQEPGLGTAHALAAALGVSLDQLFEAWENTRHQCEAKDQL